MGRHRNRFSFAETGLKRFPVMTAKNDKPDRATRLAEQLRANLRRRKAQAREGAAVETTKGDDADRADD